MPELQRTEREAAGNHGHLFSLSAGGSSLARDRAVQNRPGTPIAKTFRYRVVKRVMDISFILIISLPLVLLVGLIAAAVRIDSPGPIFFTHRRLRGQGSFFTMWKFRSMCVNSTEVLESYLLENAQARSEWLSHHKLKCDPRVTKVGNFLRRTSLDELPQMWNVLNGSMSLVGPRPIVAAEVEKYGEYFSDYCAVKPGITGLWQVSGRSHTTYEERLRLDRKYVQTWSLTEDIKILRKTLSAVLKQHGAV